MVAAKTSRGTLCWDLWRWCHSVEAAHQLGQLPSPQPCQLKKPSSATSRFFVVPFSSALSGLLITLGIMDIYGSASNHWPWSYVMIQEKWPALRQLADVIYCRASVNLSINRSSISAMLICSWWSWYGHEMAWACETRNHPKPKTSKDPGNVWKHVVKTAWQMTCIDRDMLWRSCRPGTDISSNEVQVQALGLDMRLNHPNWEACAKHCKTVYIYIYICGRDLWGLFRSLA